MSKKSTNAKQERLQKRSQKNRRLEEEISNGAVDFVDDDEEDNDVGEATASDEIKSILSNSKIYLWEFGQNDTKRDSGSKMCRLGYAKRLKVGQNFNGIVLSSEATQVMSPEDAEIISQYGIAGINCSWNRLEEIPFISLGKARNQRKLPFLVAANTVNYGKVFKMNTAEAIAAALFIAGSLHEAVALMYPFSYGEEFFKLNAEAFEKYATAESEAHVVALSSGFEKLRRLQQADKEQRRAQKALQHSTGNHMGNYMDESLLPPRLSDAEDEVDEMDSYANNEENITIAQDSADI